MAETEAPDDEVQPLAAERVRKRRWWLIAPALLLGLVALAWLARERIADDFIAGQLESMGVPATYRIESIGTDRQVIKDVVIGDPARPDMTIARVEVETVTGWGLPGVGRITLVRPRLFGTLRDGKFSFGSLDPLIFTDSQEPAALPALDIALIDGRARIESDFGPIGIKAEGAGALPDGFKGMVAAVAPRIAGGGCRGEGLSLYGKLSTRSGKARFTGPLRSTALACSGLALGPSGIEADIVADPHFDGAEGTLGIRAGRLAAGENRLAGTDGTVHFVWRQAALTAHYDLAGRQIATPQAALAALAAKGVVRTGGEAGRIEVEGDVGGSGLAMGSGLDASLAALALSGKDTLLAPLLSQVRTALARESRGSRFAGQFVLRQTGEVISLVVPQGRVTGGSGQPLLALSRLQMSLAGGSGPRLSGNFQTGGAGMPRITGRVERVPGGRLVTRMALAAYRAGDASVAMPELMLVQAPDGALGFAGEARISGALPGGSARNLAMPVEGNWSGRGGLALWRKCTPVRFESLRLANLTLGQRSLTLCPPRNGAIVRNGAGGLRIAAGAPSLALAGSLGETPIRLTSGPVGFAWPGTMAASAMDVLLGPPGSESRFGIANLQARLGSDAAGSFSGSEVRLAAVPLDLTEAAGQWRFADGRLTISEGSFRVLDREPVARFQPLTARDGSLTLQDNRIEAVALLREPESDREIVAVDMRHDLATASGQALLHVAGIRFDGKLQPDTLSRLALGVIANAEGAVAGQGRIDWNGDRVTSSGRFSSDTFDFAAAFGPVKGVSGTVEFTDLLGMVTAPDQRLRIASINPGIEANDGELSFEMRDGDLLLVNGASWPFLDGKLRLEPTRMVLGASEVRRYTLTIEGLDAARFLERLELGNLSASGLFDGTLPLIFDENGGRIEGGLLIARPPGGNVSYIGQLTYKDLSPMGNFAFDALKSIDYKHMKIEMDGALEGEIVTKVAFDGLSQGAAARQNFLTRQVSKLPIRFTVNLRAPFFRLVSSFKSLYDPAMITDPRLLGLVGADGRPRTIQPPVSETTP